MRKKTSKKQLEPRLEEAKVGQRVVFFVDAAHFVLAPYLGMLWCFVRQFVRAPAGRQRFNVLGALNAITHELILVTNDAYINADSVCELLRLIAARGFTIPITLILDNARYQKCHLVIDLAKTLGIELLYLPTYSPNLNIIERLWKFVKKDWRVLTKDSPENRGFFGEGVKVVVEVVVDPQRQIDHFDDLGDDLRAAAEPGEKVADVAVVLFDGDGQVFAGEELVIRDEAVIALPIIGDERLAFEADFVEELLACGIITATKNPGDGSPSNRGIGSPKPQFLSLFFTKCPISSRVTTTTSALVDGSGSLRASSRTQFRTATSLTPRMRAMEPKLTLPMA